MRPHRLGRNTKEVRAVFPVLAGAADQPDVGLIDQGRGLQRVIRLLVAHQTRGDVPQLLINRRQLSATRLPGSPHESR